jgi:hypothetical protein
MVHEISLVVLEAGFARCARITLLLAAFAIRAGLFMSTNHVVSIEV